MTNRFKHPAALMDLEWALADMLECEENVQLHSLLAQDDCDKAIVSCYDNSEVGKKGQLRHDIFKYNPDTQGYHFEETKGEGDIVLPNVDHTDYYWVNSAILHRFHYQKQRQMPLVTNGDDQLMPF